MNLPDRRDRAAWALCIGLVVPSLLLQWRADLLRLDADTATRVVMLLCAGGGMLLTFGCARSLFPAGASLLAVLVAYYGTFLAWSVIFEPSPPTVLGLVAGAVFLRVWCACRERLSSGGALLLGAAISLGTGFFAGPPPFLDRLFSSRDGLLFWSPVLWLGVLGLLVLGWRRRGAWLALALLVPAMAFARGFLLPILTLGLAASFAWVTSLSARHPARVIGIFGAFLSAWNGLLMETYKRGPILRDDTVSFAHVTRFNTDQFVQLFGSPVAWPANWLFARRTGLPAAAYDEMVGKDLFVPAGSPYGIVDLGDPRVDPALLGEGFGAQRLYQGELCRRVDGTARFFVNLERPEELRLAVRAAGTGRLFVLANGEPLGSLALGPLLTARGFDVPSRFLRLRLNEFTVRVSAGGSATIDRFVFERTP